MCTVKLEELLDSISIIHICILHLSTRVVNQYNAEKFTERSPYAAHHILFKAILLIDRIIEVHLN